MKKNNFTKPLFYLIFCVLPLSVFSQFKNAANVIINDGWTLKIDNYKHETGGQINLEGSLIVTGNWENGSVSATVFTAPSNGKLIFDGTGTQTISQITDFVNVELRNNINLSGTMNIAGEIILNENEVTGSGSLNLLASATIATSHEDGYNGNLLNAGTNNIISGGNYKYFGSLAQETGNFLPATIDNLIIEKTAGSVTLSRTGLTTINGTMKILSGSLIANAGSEITVGGNTTIESSNGLILKSDINNRASFIDNGTFDGSGSVKVEKFLPSGNVYGWTVASPVVLTMPAVFAGHDNTFFYNPLTPGWEAYASGTMDVMRGYFTRFNADKTLEFSDNLNTGEISFSDLYRTGYAQGNMGWNFIGNPYPSAIDWNLVVELASNTATNGSFYETTKLNNQILVSDSAGGYHAYVDGVSDDGIFNGIIPSANGFWVQVYAGPGNNENINATEPTAGPLYFDNSVRVHKGGSGSKKSSADNLILLNLSNNNISNSTVIRLRSGATINFDPAYDATKLFSQNPAHPQIYSISDNDEKLAINAIPDNFSQPVSIPIGFINMQGTQLSITANNLSLIDANISIYLEDKVTNNMYNLRNNNTYSFSSNDTLNEQRFVLHLALIISNIENGSNSMDEKTDIYSFEKNIHVSHAGENAVLSVYNMMGQEVVIKELRNNYINKITTNLPTGLYVIRITNKKGVNYKKVFIQ